MAFPGISPASLGQPMIARFLEHRWLLGSFGCGTVGMRAGELLGRIPVFRSIE